MNQPDDEGDEMEYGPQTAEVEALIYRALNPRVHGDNPDHCPACFGSCASFPGEWVDDAEELAVALATAIGPLLNKIEDWEAQASRKVEVTTDEREALIERVLKVTDDMRSGGWHSGKTVAEMGQKIYDILTESTKGY